MYNNLEKIFKLIQQTGDRCIICDPKSDEHFVVMPFSEYERLISSNTSNIRDLTQDEFLDKINRDVAIWKAGQNTENLDWDDKEIVKKEDILEDIEQEENEDKFYLEPLES